MGTSLDQTQQDLIFRVVVVVTVVLVGFLAYSEFHVLPRLHQSSHDEIGERTSKNDPLVWGWIRTFACMSFATLLITLAIIRNDIPGTFDDIPTTVTSSINFCESDFQHSRHVAEPANTVSSFTSYIPLAILGLANTTNTRYTVCFVTLFLIGIGSSLLHAFLTALSQGGDELPMLWFTAATSFCGFEIISPKKVPGLAKIVVLTAVASTVVYLHFRANFLYFTAMFSLYSWALIFSLIYISFFMPWEEKFHGRPFKRDILLPLSRCCAITVLLAVWVWYLDMAGCAYAKQQPRESYVWMIWDRILHPVWHFSTAIVAFLTVEVFIAADGFGRGLGMPRIRWYGAPVVVFEDVF